jgi:dsDNA-binding SOS-regulon protein
VRRAYELTCKTGEALRDPAAKAEVGEAIHQSIDAADGEDMATRVRDAVDVRDWVDVTYQVTRPGEQARDWGPRTGLSGDERRLVVLAPMLAADAAAYDRFPDGATRLVALDEVPSEVDQEGREDLARYIAELDLDLVATSHQWDGAPGAWDGIDAHDLEAGPDGTVVAFPMLVRGLDPLPGDDPGLHGPR